MEVFILFYGFCFILFEGMGTDAKSAQDHFVMELKIDTTPIPSPESKSTNLTTGLSCLC